MIINVVPAIVDLVFTAETPMDLDGAADVDQFLGPLTHCTSIKRVVLSGHSFGPEAMSVVAAFLCRQPHLEVDHGAWVTHQ